MDTTPHEHPKAEAIGRIVTALPQFSHAFLVELSRQLHQRLSPSAPRDLFRLAKPPARPKPRKSPVPL